MQGVQPFLDSSQGKLLAQRQPQALANDPSPDSLTGPGRKLPKGYRHFKQCRKHATKLLDTAVNYSLSFKVIPFHLISIAPLLTIFSEGFRIAVYFRGVQIGVEKIPRGFCRTGSTTRNVFLGGFKSVFILFSEGIPAVCWGGGGLGFFMGWLVKTHIFRGISIRLESNGECTAQIVVHTLF